MQILLTRPLWGPFVARMALGAVFFPHGAQKALGWFGGPGFDGALASFTKMGIPAPLGVLVVLAEFVGSLLLMLGLLTRVAALGVIAVMCGAIALVHLPNGFFMNWSGTQAGEGFEFHLLAIGLGLVGLIEGGGMWSVDGGLTAREPTRVRTDVATPA